MGEPPSIVVHSGTVEDWVIENRALEDHIFHIHQIHFQVLEANGRPSDDPALRDTIDIPFWDGKGPYPSVSSAWIFAIRISSATSFTIATSWPMKTVA